LKSNSHSHHKNKSGLWIALIFLFGFAKGQTAYPINDPRNPDCPCHKYQKLADEEFKKLLASSNNTIVKEKEIGISDDAKGKKKKIDRVKDKEVGVSDDAKGKINKTVDDKQLGESDEDKGKNKMFIPKEIDEQLENLGPNPSTPLRVTTSESGEVNVSDQKTARSGSISRAPQYTTTKHWNGKRKKHNSFYKQMKRIFYVGGWDIWKGKRITSACYHWK
jgi:hypothetical protein